MPDGGGLCEWSPVSYSPVVPFRGRQWGEVKPRYDTLLEQSYVCYIYNEKLDGLDPVNIQTLPWLALPLCQKKMWHPTGDIWHVTCDMWHVTRDIWHLTCNRWGEVNPPSKFQLPSFYGLGMMVWWRYFHKSWPNEWINELKQPSLGIFGTQNREKKNAFFSPSWTQVEILTFQFWVPKLSKNS